MNKNDFDVISGEYQYGFVTETKNAFDTGKGLNEEVVRKISSLKNEPEWMLEFRLNAYKKYLEMELPTWGADDLSAIDFDEITYYVKPGGNNASDWNEVPEEIKETFDKLGIPEAEQKYLSGVHTQFESEVVYHNMMDELSKEGIVFLDTDSALREYPEIFKKYFNTVVSYTDNKFAALNGAVWSGGTFIYVPKGAKLERPLQSYFRINSENMGQFERTLIIVDEGADVHYVEGCTAPTYSSASLHAAVVEIVILKDGKCRYSTIQNWSNNIYNLVTKRAKCMENASMEWIDGNIGSAVTMKYPACVLQGDSSKGTTISIAIASNNQVQDAGAKMIHLGKNTKSSIISKSISKGGGNVTYRGIVSHGSKAIGATSNIECDTIIIDALSKSDTIPTNIVRNDSSTIQHEATVSKVSEDQLFYLMSRGLSEEEATEMIVMGFIEPFSRELPMEYAVELNQLIKIEMEGSIG
ncbi:MAG: Fe-S cluster assembly protein SufB [Bacilli bacterium]